MSHDIDNMTPQQLAEACANALYSRDNASQQAGMTLESVEPGKSVVNMPVRDDITMPIQEQLIVELYSR